MRGRRGVALLAVLWLLAAAGMLAATGLAAGRLGAAVTRNRFLLLRAGWAREACVAILAARLAADSAWPTPAGSWSLAPVQLGRGTWCAAHVTDPGARLALATADSATLTGLLGDAARARTLLRWREAHGPLPAVAALAEVPGLEGVDLAALATLATTRGDGALNMNAASAAVLERFAPLPAEARAVVLRRRAAGAPVPSLDALLGLVSAPTARTLLADYASWLGRVRFAPTVLEAVVVGGVAGTPLTSRVVLTLAPVPGRLAVLRREAE